MPTVKEPPESPPAPPEQLDSSEIFWRDIQPWLQSRGYQLRRRYRPGWIPAWKQRKTSLFWWEFEDSMKAHVRLNYRLAWIFTYSFSLLAPVSDGREAHFG